MNAVKIAGIALILAGIPGLVYGSFTYTRDTHEADPGPTGLSVTEKGTVNAPVRAGAGAIPIGGGLQLGNRKSSVSWHRKYGNTSQIEYK